MSAFRNICVSPHHGSRSAVLTWDYATGTPQGLIYVAYSTTGTPGSWTTLNKTSPVDSGLRTFTDTTLEINAGAVTGFYRLLLRVAGTPPVDLVSEPVGLYGLLTPKEFGLARGIMAREYKIMRYANGYPVWHCIPRDKGALSDMTDPDTMVMSGFECPDKDVTQASFGLPFKGGFYPPVLTWILPKTVKRGTMSDHPEDRAVVENDLTEVRMLAFPRPQRGHMIVDPTTDRRYLVGDEIHPCLLRGILPVAYDATLDFLNQGDPRYSFELPAVDIRAYRRL